MELPGLLPLLIQIFPKYPSAPGGLWERIKPGKTHLFEVGPLLHLSLHLASRPRALWGRDRHKIPTTQGVDRVGTDARLAGGHFQGTAATSRSLKEGAVAGFAEHRQHEEGA